MLKKLVSERDETGSLWVNYEGLHCTIMGLFFKASRYFGNFLLGSGSFFFLDNCYFSLTSRTYDAMYYINPLYKEAHRDVFSGTISFNKIND